MNGKRSPPLRSGLLGPWRTRPDRHIMPRHVRVGWKINGRQTALAGVRPDEQGPTSRGTAVPSYPPPSSGFQWKVPAGGAQCIHHAGAFLSFHWWDFSVPPGSAARLEQFEPRPPWPRSALRALGGVRVAYHRRGPRSECTTGPLTGLGLAHLQYRKACST